MRLECDAGTPSPTLTGRRSLVKSKPSLGLQQQFSICSVDVKGANPATARPHCERTDVTMFRPALPTLDGRQTRQARTKGPARLHRFQTTASERAIIRAATRHGAALAASLVWPAELKRIELERDDSEDSRHGLASTSEAAWCGTPSRVRPSNSDRKPATSLLLLLQGGRASR
ncbi:unnamed protein product [Lampetra planeri]